MKQISHYGKVIDKSNSYLKVEIIRYSACHNCDAKHGCGLMECKNKTLEIPHSHTNQFQIGDEVLINIAQNLGIQAIILGYLIPLILMILTLISVYAYSSHQLKSGISAIIILIPYYLWLFLKRKRLAEKFRFTVSKIME